MFCNQNPIVLITALTDKYSGLLLEEFINKRYSVSSAQVDGNISLSRKDSVSPVIGIILSGYNISLSPSIIAQEVIDALNNINALYYSIVVIVGADVAWVPGNIIVKSGEQNPPNNKIKTNLRLVKNTNPYE